MRFFYKPHPGLLLSCLLLFVHIQTTYAQTWTHTPRYTSITGNTGGFYEYLPSGYNSNTDKYPLMIFIHGVGELGSGASGDLQRVLANGVPRLINQGIFPESFTVNGQSFKFIVISPQFKNWPTALDINSVINYAIQNYRVNTSRIYVTGLSMGGGVTWEYVGNNVNYGKRVAAIVPVCGASWPDYTRSRIITASNVAVWATHNDGDPTVPVFYTNDYVTNINTAPAPTPPAKKTIFSSGSHDAWTRTYDFNNFKEGGLNVFEWMLQYQRDYGGVNQVPFADAGYDVIQTLPTNSVQLNAINSWDLDGFITTYNWTRVSGPTQYTITNNGTINPTVSDLVPGTYTFRLTVTDNSGATATDDVVVVQNDQPVIPGKVEAENYSAMNGIGNEPTNDAGGGYNVAYIEAGDWMDYTPTVQAAAVYTVNFRVACPNAGAQFQLRKSDGTVLATMTVPQTGGYQNWATINTTVTLPAGVQTLRIYSLSAGWNINWMEFISNTPINQPPTVSAGENQTIIAPASTATLSGSASDPDGSIASYNWTFVSGPVTPSIASANSAVTGISGLSQQGTYIFNLAVTDNSGASASANVAVTVSGTAGQNKYYRVITIDHNKVANTAQTNFPVLIGGVYDFLKNVAYGGKVNSASGYDIIFTSDAAGTAKLSWEMEKYNPATGEIAAWVKTDLSPSQDKVIYMHYGDNTVGAFQGNVAGTWNSSYASVHHLANGTTLSGADATVNANNGTVGGATATTGQIDGAAAMNGAPQYINIGNKSALGITGNLTLEAWVNPTDFSNYSGIIGKTAGSYPKPYDFYLNQTSGIPQLYRGNGNAGGYSNVPATAAPTPGVWSHLVVTITGNTVRHYLNGVLNGTGNLTVAGTTGTENVFIGSRTDFGTKYKGKIDEVRILNAALSADWIKTEYNNQSSPSTFYNMSAENSGSGNQPPVVSAGSSQTITQPASTATLTGTASDPDGSISTLAWTFVSGPATPTIASPSTASTTVNGLTAAGDYIFRLTATDNSGTAVAADVTITVQAAGGGGSDDFYRPITINKAQVVGAAQTNFPVLISGTYDFLRTTANGGRVINTNGYDIRFTTDIAGANKLNWEVEKYNPATGEFIAWVKTDVSPTEDKVIYLHYGNNTINSFQGNSANTWNNTYVSVHHLSNGTTLSAADATANANNGTITGATANTGKIDGAASLSGAPQYINIGNSSSLGITGSMTIEAWINPADFSNYNGIVGKTSGAYGFPKPYDFYLTQGSGIPQLYRGNGQINGYANVGGSSAPAANTWSHIVVTVSGNTVTHYLNGNVNGTGTLSAAGAPANGTESVLIGSRNDGATKFKGRMDEVRILNTALSANWIKTEYNNQSSPAAFYTIGAEVGTGNQLPVANAGPNQVITLPASSVTLNGSGTDSDGTITTYNWSLVSGPNTPAIVSPASASTTVNGLVEGVYSFRLTVTDNNGGIGTSDVTVTVNSNSTPGGKYRMITINHSQVSNAFQSNFPVMISGTYPYLRTTANGGKVNSNNGYDILFTTDVNAANRLSWEIEKYNPVTGELLAWVKTNVSPATDQVIYMHYGDNTISSFQGNVAGTWNSNYAGVYHLANGTTLSAADATGYNNSGTVTGASATTGPLDGCANFTGGLQYINLGSDNNLGITGNLTLEAWVNPADYSNYNAIVGKTSGAYGIPKPYDFYLTQGSGIPQLYRGNGELNGYANVGGSAAPPAGSWSHIAVTISGNTVTHYLNGVANGSGTLSAAGSPLNGTDNVYIGTRNDMVTRFKGKMDEVRIVNGALSADWIRTEYNNQVSPATFYTIGNESAAARMIADARKGTQTAKAVATDDALHTNGAAIAIYPNPAKDQFVLQLNNKKTGTADIQFINQQGLVSKRLRIAKNKEQTQTQLSVADLSKGTYVIRVTVGDWTESVKLLKL